jgi:hypothetical protein
MLTERRSGRRDPHMVPPSITKVRENRALLKAVARLLLDGRAAEVRRFVENPLGEKVGPFVSEDAALGFLRDRLVAMLRPAAIWLFGSRARGEAQSMSDFDLLVVLPDGRPSEEYSYETAARPVMSSGLGYDIAPCRWSEFVAGLETPGCLVFNIIGEARLIYKARHIMLPPLHIS